MLLSFPTTSTQPPKMRAEEEKDKDVSKMGFLNDGERGLMVCLKGSNPQGQIKKSTLKAKPWWFISML